MAGTPSSTQIATLTNRFVRPGFVIILSAAACLSLVLFTVVHWAEQQVLTPETWSETIGPLPKNPAVANALSTYVATNLFSNVPIESQIQQALPPRAAFLASPLASQLQTLTQNITHKIITGDKFQQLWTDVNKAAMARLVANARNPNQSGGRLDQVFNLDLSGVKSFISKRLGTAAGEFPALNPNNSKALEIKTNLQAKRQQIWSYIRKVDFLAAILPFVIIACLFGALALSHHRRRTLLEIAIVVTILLLVELIASKAARQSLLDQVKHAEYHTAVGYIFDTLTSPLHNVINIWLIAAIGTIVICELTSPAIWAARMRKRLAQYFSFAPKLLHAWHTLRAWVNKYRVGLWCGIVAIWLFWMAFLADINNTQLLRGILVALIIAECIFLLAHPRVITRTA